VKGEPFSYYLHKKPISMSRFFTAILLWSLLSFAAFSQNAEAPLFSFGVMADVQYCDCKNNGSRHYSSSLGKLHEAVQVFNQEQVKFVVSLGDFIDRDAQSFDTLNKITKQLRMPLHHILGNHDFSGAQEEIEKAPAYLGLKEKYYSFKNGGWRFIVLNGNDISVLGNKENSKKHLLAQRRLAALKGQGAPNAQPWNGELGEQQLAWLKKQLKSSLQANERVIVMCHHPISPERGSLNLWNDSEVKRLLESFPNVKAYFNGHAHEGGYDFDKGKHYVTFKGMVEKDGNAFAIIEVYRDYLKINGYGVETDRVLK
jgi:manganese-dependent ADP-ribose/CDP-alcohol diphosphatase